MSATLPKTTNLPTCPYKGLMPYTEEDALFFFGREGECEIITANLRAARLTLLYGMSGVGKSSVLQAGVTHTLLEQAQQRLDDFQFPGFAPVVFRDWQSDPLEGLSRQIEQTILSLFERFDLEPVLATSNLADLLKAWTERTKGKLLIILDQFEEYFLYHPHEEGEGAFAYEFPLAVNRPDLKVNFLISIREDQLSRLDRFKGRIPSLFDNYLRIDYLNREEAEKAIREPLAQFNHLLPKGQNYLEIEDALVQAVLEQV